MLGELVDVLEAEIRILPNDRLDKSALVKLIEVGEVLDRLRELRTLGAELLLPFGLLKLRRYGLLKEGLRRLLDEGGKLALVGEGRGELVVGDLERLGRLWLA